MIFRNVTPQHNTCTHISRSRNLLRRFSGVAITALLVAQAPALSADAPPSGWTWESGEPEIKPVAHYGTLGVADPLNTPGTRDGSATWTDTSGNLWLFGGSVFVGDEYGLANDVWMYDRNIKQWTWKAGDNTPDHVGNYGIKGTGSTANLPGSRTGSTAWLDSAGAVWIFGGIGFDTTGPQARLNDLWKYEPANGKWTWVKGSNSSEAQGDYSAGQGVANSTINPGARSSATGWVDASGDLWLFGGDGFATGLSSGLLGDVWRFNPTSGNWAWIKGPAIKNTTAVTGTQGTAAPGNTPGGLSDVYRWVDAAGKVWMYGGFGYGTGAYSGWLNDLWRYDPVANQWTWMSGTNTTDQPGVYGDMGVQAPTNAPGSRSSGSAWVDSGGNFCMYGGIGFIENFDLEELADIWIYYPGSNQWAWVGGTKSTTQTPVYGTLDVGNANNTPGNRQDQLTWPLPDGNAWIFGGEVLYQQDVNLQWSDLWSIQTASVRWTWRGGPKAQVAAGSYGTIGVSSPANVPGARIQAYSWAAPDGKLWLFGGNGADKDGTIGLLNDMWQFDPATKEWTWKKGSNTESAEGVYGTLGSPNINNTPGGREDGNTWVDNSGNFWLFGGFTVRLSSGSHIDIKRNDLWKYDPIMSRWTWMKGGRYNQDVGVYGTKGVADSANTPGARQGAASWKDSTGKFWLFGGYGAPSDSPSADKLNDLWKYDPDTNLWTWMSGSNIGEQYGIYGTEDVATSGSVPGARRDSVSWVGSDGNLWLFGGNGRPESGFSGQLNDLWKYNIAANQWTWISGSKTRNQKSTYGDKGVSDALNTPGAREDSATWTDAENLYLFGGNGPSADSTFGWPLDDFWRFNFTTQEWTWIGGTDEHNAPPMYGTKGTLDESNTPGARIQSTYWTAPDGNFWLFSGGADLSPVTNDLWQLSIITPPASAQGWQWME